MEPLVQIRRRRPAGASSTGPAPETPLSTERRGAFVCANPWTTSFVWTNGDVTHCCYSNIGALGNVNRQSFDEIWHGPKATLVRERMAKGDFIGAGCEHFCRVYRWNRLYAMKPARSRVVPTGLCHRTAGADGDDIPEIPEGLGRTPGFAIPAKVEPPAILGIAADWQCNLKCTHCQAERGQAGLDDKNVEGLWHMTKSVKTLRFVGGEFTVNKKTLANIERVSRQDPQPTVFMNTSGQLPPSDYAAAIDDLRSFRLKFSLEGLGARYEAVRKGASFARFEENLLAARALFDRKNAEGNDWRLYMNLCVGASNFDHVPDVVTYAVEKNIRLVINTLNGMRHLDENVAMYEHLRIPRAALEAVRARVDAALAGRAYLFAAEVRQHLDYVIRTFDGDEKLSLPAPALRLIARLFRGKHFQGQNADRALYILYKWQTDKRACVEYVSRKLRKVAAQRVAAWAAR